MSLKAGLALGVVILLAGLALALRWSIGELRKAERSIGGYAAAVETISAENASLAEANRYQRRAAELDGRITATVTRSFEASLAELARMQKDARLVAPPLPPGCPAVAPSLDALADRLDGLRAGAAARGGGGRDGAAVPAGVPARLP